MKSYILPFLLFRNKEFERRNWGADNGLNKLKTSAHSCNGNLWHTNHHIERGWDPLEIIQLMFRQRRQPPTTDDTVNFLYNSKQHFALENRHRVYISEFNTPTCLINRNRLLKCLSSCLQTKCQYNNYHLLSNELAEKAYRLLVVKKCSSASRVVEFHGQHCYNCHRWSPDEWRCPFN